MAQECYTSCAFPLVTPYLALSPDKNQPTTSCSFHLYHLFLLKSGFFSSLDLKMELQKAQSHSLQKCQDFRIFFGNECTQKTLLKENQAAPERFSPYFPNQACYSWALSNWGIFPLPLLTIHYLKMFTLRIKSPSELESVVHSQLLLLGSVPLSWLLKAALPLPGWGRQPTAGACGYKPVQQLASLGTCSSARPRGLGFCQTDIFSMSTNTGPSVPLHSTSSHLISPSGLTRAALFPNPPLLDQATHQLLPEEGTPTDVHTNSWDDGQIQT